LVSLLDFQAGLISDLLIFPVIMAEEGNLLIWALEIPSFRYYFHIIMNLSQASEG